MQTSQDCYGNVGYTVSLFNRTFELEYGPFDSALDLGGEMLSIPAGPTLLTFSIYQRFVVPSGFAAPVNQLQMSVGTDSFFQPTAVIALQNPEPVSVLLMLTGLAGLGYGHRRYRANRDRG